MMKLKRFSFPKLEIRIMIVKEKESEVVLRTLDTSEIAKKEIIISETSKVLF